MAFPGMLKPPQAPYLLYDPPEREKALERQRKMAEDTVKYLKEFKSNGEIIRWWESVHWIGGFVPLPENWRKQ